MLNFRNIVEIPFRTAEDFPDRVSHKTRIGNSFIDKTYFQLSRDIRALGTAFAELGIGEGDHVSFFVCNRYEWIVCNFSVMLLSAVTVPRGSDTTVKEQHFIYQHSDSTFLIVENISQLNELTAVFTDEDRDRCRNFIVVDDGDPNEVDESLRSKIRFLEPLLEKGRALLEKGDDRTEEWLDQIDQERTVTIVYTSGTTGNPKGVMLNHRNFLQQVIANTERLQVDRDNQETTVIMLPSWHVFEMAFEYVGLYLGLMFVYSSPMRFASDLSRFKPHLIISVPRIWESIYQKIIKAIGEMSGLKKLIIFSLIKHNQRYIYSSLYLEGAYISYKKRTDLRRFLSSGKHKFRRWINTPQHLAAEKLFKSFRDKVGGRLRVAVCGAGSLPLYLDELFNSIGIPIVNAYGMTETAPGLLSREIHRNTYGSTGIPFANTEIKLLKEDGSVPEVGEKGILYARGPQVMQGYYKNPAATEAVLDSEGWMNTGDIAVQSENGEYVIVGRFKDTIVLSGGENVEPENIESKMKESAYIDHAVVLGQDRKQLTALVAMNEEELMNLAARLKLREGDYLVSDEQAIENPHILDHVKKEIDRLISKEQGFKAFEKISKVLLVRNSFTIGRELTQSLKVKRKYVEEKYQNLIHKLHIDVGRKRKK
ncbi:AMP-dependent synthetase/ligase [Spirochaeta isovalerica]|uniref:Long-chain acyl-CoA synthetase n=1 Tax=Spirochaeta isovalerica TaxID=150 RepID=A0A841RDV9_9SPIO|nr:AMP-binding protein [Spirochaeta isovalerica]MBB6482245.1 long-chain acyl-CoA synthetase [Spirochaeta isovalerica]